MAQRNIERLLAAEHLVGRVARFLVKSFDVGHRKHGDPAMRDRSRGSERTSLPTGSICLVRGAAKIALRDAVEAATALSGSHRGYLRPRLQIELFIRARRGSREDVHAAGTVLVNVHASTRAPREWHVK